MEPLPHRGADVAYYDPHVPVVRLTREHPHWGGYKIGPKGSGDDRRIRRSGQSHRARQRKLSGIG